MSQQLFFNGVDLATGDYGRSPVDASAFTQTIRVGSVRDPLQDKDLAAWADKKRLDQAGWGVIVHEDEDQAILEALEPLIEMRRQDAGPLFKNMMYRKSDRDQHPDGPAAFFLTRHGVSVSGDVDPQKAPYYILIIGSPELIPFDFQYELDISFAVGRLCLETPQHYAAYAQNVINTAQEARIKRNLTLFGAENDDLTRLCTSHLSKPLANRLDQLEPDWDVSLISGQEATRARLETLMGGNQTPALLMTLGHGLLYSRPDIEERLRFQGGLLCSDWGGPGHQLKPEHGYFAEDISPDLDMRGSIAFFFACFTAGTPRFDNFEADKDLRTERHPHPVVSRLPASLLAHPRGPLAIIGHVDQAYQYSFLWDDQIHEITHFTSAFYRLMHGEPVGAAMEPFNRRFAEISARVTSHMMRYGPSEHALLRSWTAWHDSRNYVVLGDPAVSLNLENAS